MASHNPPLGEEGLDASALTPATASVFLAARRAAGFTSYLSVKALGPLLGYLHGIGVAPVAVELHRAQFAGHLGGLLPDHARAA